MGERRWEAEDRRWEMGDGKREIENGTTANTDITSQDDVIWFIHTNQILEL